MSGSSIQYGLPIHIRNLYKDGDHSMIMHVQFRVQSNLSSCFHWFSHNVIHACRKQCPIFTDFPIMSYKHVENYVLCFTDFPIMLYKHVEIYVLCFTDFPIISYKHVEIYVLFSMIFPNVILKTKSYFSLIFPWYRSMLKTISYFHWFSHNVIEASWKLCLIFTDFPMS